MDSELNFIFDPDKNSLLKEARGVGFEDVIFSIKQNKLLDILPHPRDTKYPNQWILIVEIDGYAYQVPFHYQGDQIKLITVFPSRKSTSKYLRGNQNE